MNEQKASESRNNENANINSKKAAQRESGDANKGKAPEKQQSAQPDIWALEDVFPQLSGLLGPSAHLSASDKDTLVVLDTNALLLPFYANKEELLQIEKVYAKLASESRLFVPARVIREFIKNRDGRLAEIAKTLNDKRTSVPTSGMDVPPLLQGLEETKAMTSAANEFKRVRKTYLDSVTQLVDLIRAWRGDDPVTSTYRGIFQGDVIVDVKESREEIEKGWAVRLRRKVPPGYKDGAKQDTGIGDFLVWLSILRLAREQEKSLIFVTGEEKADWFVRSDNEGVYPRPELVDEYRTANICVLQSSQIS
ncbi:PIN domain-containing protein [Bradyrhizobium barranii subsp. barranii]|uniref:DUF4935 domain-containing protein n=1 Tax=Bradyrhizobium barranii subsp. barranii TaxID=2823807 RepID=A0A7Z0QBP5_9BRAD|nr:PIN domain-containing protein [Bradyrhizobium barranii]UGX93094.1 PIN domain-containing protein [Bradyrhizobium barranii subsp. barranii]